MRRRRTNIFNYTEKRVVFLLSKWHLFFHLFTAKSGIAFNSDLLCSFLRIVINLVTSSKWWTFFSSRRSESKILRITSHKLWDSHLLFDSYPNLSTMHILNTFLLFFNSNFVFWKQNTEHRVIMPSGSRGTPASNRYGNRIRKMRDKNFWNAWRSYQTGCRIEFMHAKPICTCILLPKKLCLLNFPKQLLHWGTKYSNTKA